MPNEFSEWCVLQVEGKGQKLLHEFRYMATGIGHSFDVVHLFHRPENDKLVQSWFRFPCSLGLSLQCAWWKKEEDPAPESSALRELRITNTAGEVVHRWQFRATMQGVLDLADILNYCAVQVDPTLTVDIVDL